MTNPLTGVKVSLTLPTLAATETVIYVVVPVSAAKAQAASDLVGDLFVLEQDVASHQNIMKEMSDLFQIGMDTTALQQPNK